MQDEQEFIQRKVNKRERAAALFSPDPLKRSHTLNKSFVKEITTQEKKVMEEQFSNAIATGDFSSFNQM